MQVLHKGSKGEQIRTLQAAVNNRARHLRLGHITVDGVLGDDTLHAVRETAKLLGATDSTLAKSRHTGQVSVGLQRMIEHPDARTPAQRSRAKAAQKAHYGDLNQRAYRVAKSLVGIMEVGGNNTGAAVTKIIRENGGVGPEPWCGDTMAYCYRHAGSKAVQRNWASVPAYSWIFGVTATSNPTCGDLVRFEFTGDRTPDHIGMFVEWCDANGNKVPRGSATHIKTIEGNTGSSGAVSDSRTGGDGVYEKVRSRSLVRDYLHVSK